MKTHCCEEMVFHLAGGEVAIIYTPKFREYGIKILDGGSSFQLIYYCPWCGCKLPSSMRMQWFDELDKLKLEPGNPNIPANMLTDKWWKNLGKNKVTSEGDSILDQTIVAKNLSISK